MPLCFPTEVTLSEIRPKLTGSHWPVSFYPSFFSPCVNTLLQFYIIIIYYFLGGIASAKTVFASSCHKKVWAQAASFLQLRDSKYLSLSLYVKNQGHVAYMKFESRSILIYAHRMICYCIKAKVTLIQMGYWIDILYYKITCFEAEETKYDYVTGPAQQR